jgi:hypothetical protein
VLIVAIQPIMLGTVMTNVIILTVMAPLKAEFVNIAKKCETEETQIEYFETGQMF